MVGTTITHYAIPLLHYSEGISPPNSADGSTLKGCTTPKSPFSCVSREPDLKQHPIRGALAASAAN